MMRSKSSPPVTLREDGAQLIQAPLALTHCPAPSLSLPSSQLHGQVEMGRALVDVLQSHDVGVADPAQQEKAPMGRCRPLCASVLPHTSAPFPTIATSAQSSKAEPQSRPSWGHRGGRDSTSTPGHCPEGLEC